MRAWRVVVALFLLPPLCLVLWGCEPNEDAVIRLGIAGRPANLDPLYATDAASSRVNRLLYASLVRFNERFEPVPHLAEWERLSPRHYRFRLAEDRARFHDGTRLGAVDVKATYDYVLDADNASPHRASVALIDRVEVVDADTLDFHLNRSDPLFPGYLTIGIVPAGRLAQEHDFQRLPVGSGPVEFIERLDDGHILLKRRHDNQMLAIQQIKDPTVRVLKLQRREVDIVQNDLPAELIRYLQENESIHVVKQRGTNFAYIGFNMEDPLTGRHAVREAVGQAIDRDAVIEHVLAGAARPAGALLPPEHWAGVAGLDGVAYDPGAARAALAELGYGAENPLQLTYKTSSDPLRIRIATIFQDQLARVGIDVDLQIYDWGTFYGDIKAGRFQMYTLAWVGIKTPDIFQYVFHSDSLPPGGANRGRYSDPQVDAWIEAAQAADTLEQQKRYYHRIQRRLAETLPYIPLWYEDHVYAAHADISGYTLSRDGNYDGLMSVQRR